MQHGAETRRYRAVIAYDGTGFHGFQRQTNATPTIQGTLENALEAIFKQPTPITGAGRTDTGVHATGQVIAFTASWNHTPQQLKNALNATLPTATAVWQLDETTEGFHPRFDARSRIYQYRLWQAATQNPLKRNYQWHVKEALDISALESAAEYLPGEHDFATFGTPPQGDNTRRTVYRAAWTTRRVDGKNAYVHEFVIEADAFLYRMVRSLVGTLRQVGAGRMSPAEFAQALQAADRGKCGPTAPPQGLTLVGVNY